MVTLAQELNDTASVERTEPLENIEAREAMEEATQLTGRTPAMQARLEALIAAAQPGGLPSHSWLRSGSCAALNASFPAPMSRTHRGSVCPQGYQGNRTWSARSVSW